MRNSFPISLVRKPLDQVALSRLVSDLSAELRDYLTEAQPRYENDLAIIESLGEPGKLLELGAYPYCMSFFLKELGYSVTGLDLKVSRANQLLQKHCLEVYECDIENAPFPFEDATFDLVIFNEVIEHLRINPLHTLSEINRCLKPDGLLMLTTPNLYGITMVRRYLTGKGIEDPVAAFRKFETTGHMGHLRTYARHDVESLLSETGFTVKGYTVRPLYSGNAAKMSRKRAIYRILPKALHDDLVFIAGKVGCDA